MEKVTVSISDRQNSYVKAEAGRLNISDAEIVRRALDFYIDHFPCPPSVDEKRVEEEQSKR